MNLNVTLVWIPAHKGITENEIVDSVAKSASVFGSKVPFRILYTDVYSELSLLSKVRFENYLKVAARNKGTSYYEFFHSITDKPWFGGSSLNRNEITLISRIRSNHYNLNYSLNRKNIVDSPACPCGDSVQDINHMVFYCPLVRHEAQPLVHFLKKYFPLAPLNILPLLKKPHTKLCRLLLAFIKSLQQII